MFLQSHGTWRFRRLMFRALCRPGRPALGPARRRSRGPEPCHLLGLAGRALQASRRDRFSSSGAPTLSLPSSSGAPNIQCFLGSACLPCSRPLQVSKIRHLPPEGIGRRRHCGKQVVDKYLNPFSSVTDGRDSLSLPPSQQSKKKTPATLGLASLLLNTDHLRAKAPVTGRNGAGPSYPGLATRALITLRLSLCPGTLNLGASRMTPLLHSANSKIQIFIESKLPAG